eukprot:TRINITY_DN15967_c0_g2_i1.p1 TRINITY_DN15967_c0_g2~~TRINITY_DN15967_c0_g2_i1.p1  ORF type:complete len:628 (+),score=236.51 TRINITY_DN15967_c0_g2_i1:92-1975(+)
MSSDAVASPQPPPAAPQAAEEGDWQALLAQNKQLTMQSRVWMEKNRLNKERIFTLEQQNDLAEDKHRKSAQRMRELEQRLGDARDDIDAAAAASQLTARLAEEELLRARIYAEELDEGAVLHRTAGGLSGLLCGELQREVEQLGSALKQTEDRAEAAEQRASAAEQRAEAAEERADATEQRAADAAEQRAAAELRAEETGKRADEAERRCAELAEAAEAAETARAAAEAARAETADERAALEATVADLRAEHAIEAKKQAAKLRDLQHSAAEMRSQLEVMKAQEHDAISQRDVARQELIQEKLRHEKHPRGSKGPPRQVSADRAASSVGDMETRVLTAQQDRDAAVDEAEGLRQDNLLLRQDNDKKAAIIQELMYQMGGAQRPAQGSSRRLSFSDFELPRQFATVGSGGGKDKGAAERERQIRCRMQAVMEETLLNNIALQTNIEALSAELQVERERRGSQRRPTGMWSAGSDDSISAALSPQSRASSIAGLTPSRSTTHEPAADAATPKPPPKQRGPAPLAPDSPASAPDAPSCETDEKLLRIRRANASDPIGLRFSQSTVTHVHEGTPAKAAGVRVGMLIVAVAGLRVGADGLTGAFRGAPASFYIRVVPPERLTPDGRRIEQHL